jgi:hypothetical protein
MWFNGMNFVANMFCLLGARKGLNSISGLFNEGKK